MIDLTGKVALITGGTMGIGLGAALAYGRAGAQTIVTHHWGSADEDKIRAEFHEAKAPEPMILQADVASEDDTAALFEAIATQHAQVDVFVSNVAFALKTDSVENWTQRALFQSLKYSAWPLWAYTQRIQKTFGRYPKYVIGVSSDGPDGFFMNYDFVAMSKSVLETMCRYMNYRLYEDGVRVNVVRARLVRTESFDATFGVDFHSFLERMGGFEDCYVSPEELGKVILALGSGLFDAVGSQVIMVDKGFGFFDNLMGIAERTKEKGAPEKEDGTYADGTANE